MNTKLIGISRKRKVFGKSRRQFPCVSKDTTKQFIKLCSKYKLNFIHNATVLDINNRIIGFSYAIDVTIPQFQI